jgi:peptide/nickel transport system ATP-binding protein
VALGRTARCLRPFDDPIGHRADGPARAPASSEVDADPDAHADADAGRASSAADAVLLRVEAVTASFGAHEVVHDVTFDVRRGEWLALVGRSGAGKTTLVRAIAGLHPPRAGAVVLDGEPLAGSARRRRPGQRKAVHLVLQHPHAAFNPRRTIGESVSRPSQLAGASRPEARRRAAAMLERVGLDGAVAGSYPDEVAGGELQRAAIARALIGGPQLLVCDEITSSLDTVVQAAIIELLVQLRVELGLAIIFVTHDLALAAATSDRTAVLADGRLVEIGPTADVFTRPRRAETRDLLAPAVPARR